MRAPRLIAAVVLAFLWFAVAILPTTPVGVLICVIVSLGVLVAAVLYERRHAHGHADARREALREALHTRLRAAGPELGPALRELEEDAREAANRLRGVVPGSTARGKVDALPWVLCLGLPGSGRSSALANTGLSWGFATPPASPRGPRSVRWWLAAEGVFIDTGGALVSSESGAAEWLSLLQAIESMRPVQPLHGVVVTVSADTLASARPEDLDGWGRRVRERLDEALGYLGIDVPVHLLVTRCDLVPGFAEFFADLRDDERGQAWGFTLALAGAATPAPTRISQEFDLLVRTLSQRTLRRTGPREPLEMRLASFQFPHWFNGLRANLGQLAATLFAHNAFQPSILARGVWFTAAVDPPRYASPAHGRPLQSGRGYFLRDVFARHLLPDAALALPSSGELRRRLHQRLLFAAPLFSASVVAAVLSVYAYSANVDLLRDYTTVMNTSARGPAPLELRQLDTLRRHTAHLRELVAQEPPRWMRLGMFVGDTVSPRASTLYSLFVIRDLAGPETERVRRELAVFAARHAAAPVSPETRAVTEENLRLYLLLSTPRLTGEPDPSRDDDAAWLAAQLAQRWARTTRVTEPNAIAMMQSAARLHASVLGSDARLGTPRDLQLVARVRALLATR